MSFLLNRLVSLNRLHPIQWRTILSVQSVRGGQRLFQQSAVLRKPAEINTNVTKDVILFHYENPKFFRIMNTVGILQYGFWGYISLSILCSDVDLFNISKRMPADAPWYKRLLAENYRNFFFFITAIVGTGTLFMVWMYTIRTIRYLILHKGGRDVTFVTYTPFGKNAMMRVDLKNVSCQASRTGVKAQLPIKVRNKIMYYLVDMRGEFKSPNLFDHTAGLKREFKKQRRSI